MSRILIKEEIPQRRGFVQLVMCIVIAAVLAIFAYVQRKVVFGPGTHNDVTVHLAAPGQPVKALVEAQATNQVEGRRNRINIKPDGDATEIIYPVYFGTDRLPLTPYDGVSTWRFIAAIVAWLVAAFCIVLWIIVGMARWRLWIGIALFLVSLVLALLAFLDLKPQKYNEFAEQAYGDGRGELKYGVCTVSIPQGHKPGALEAPSLLSFEFKEDPEKHVVLQRVDTMNYETFKHDLGMMADTVAWREAIVFVHGYNVSFENAARRAAQIAYDTKFGGIAAFYSWPANGHTLAYTWDEQSADYTVPHLREFLELLAKEGNLKRIHVIAHSMGNRCVLAALRQKRDLRGCRIDQCVFAAADVDRDTFDRGFQELVGDGIAEPDRIGQLTLYASSKDFALNASQVLHRFVRAGDARPGVFIAFGLESVDASLLETDYLGHSYVGDSPYIINDLTQMLEERLPTVKRKNMVGIPVGARKYYRFQP